MFFSVSQLQQRRHHGRIWQPQPAARKRHPRQRLHGQHICFVHHDSFWRQPQACLGRPPAAE